VKLPLSRQRIELAYSILLVILIPTCMVVSTLWLTSQVKSNFDEELRTKANLANEVFGVSVANTLRSQGNAEAGPVLQQLIDQTLPQAPDIAQLAVTVPLGSGFETIASSDPSKLDQPDTTIQTQLAWSKSVPIASLIAAGETADREWLVATPVTNTSGQTVAITTMRVSLQASDALMDTTLRNSFILLAVMIVVIILLLLNHFRFVEYAELFRKQKELDQMKDDFISIATHELKAPMSIIRGYISMALEEKVSKTVKEMLTTGFEQTNRLNRLVTDLLDVSRIEQGRTKYDLTPTDLAPIVTAIVDTFQPKAKDKKLRLTYKPPANLPQVSADPDRLQEIFTNLIDNAIKYSPSGTITIQHVVETSAVTTIVQDTGIGLTKEEQSHLFQRFYRARNKDTQNIAGTGLGLWIIKQYAEHMGGAIQIESEKGHGSKFIVTLARVSPAAPESD
jgi:signal transduction histidine kinase